MKPEVLNQWASAFGERFWRKAKFEKRRNTLCTRKGCAASAALLRRWRLRDISSFSNRSIGSKDSAKVEAHWFRGSGKTKNALSQRLRAACAVVPPEFPQSCSAGAHASVTGGPVRAYWLPFGRMLKGDIRAAPAAAFHRPAALCAHGRPYLSLSSHVNDSVFPGRSDRRRVVILAEFQIRELDRRAVVRMGRRLRRCGRRLRLGADQLLQILRDL